MINENEIKKQINLLARRTVEVSGYTALNVVITPTTLFIQARNKDGKTNSKWFSISSLKYYGAQRHYLKAVIEEWLFAWHYEE